MVLVLNLGWLPGGGGRSSSLSSHPLPLCTRTPDHLVGTCEYSALQVAWQYDAETMQTFSAVRVIERLLRCALEPAPPPITARPIPRFCGPRRSRLSPSCDSLCHHSLSPGKPQGGKNHAGADDRDAPPGGSVTRRPRRHHLPQAGSKQRANRTHTRSIHCFLWSFTSHAVLSLACLGQSTWGRAKGNFMVGI